MPKTDVFVFEFVEINLKKSFRKVIKAKDASTQSSLKYIMAG